jgi:hypothetical protein
MEERLSVPGCFACVRRRSPSEAGGARDCATVSLAASRDHHLFTKETLAITRGSKGP